MNKVAIYVRVSTHHQVDKDSLPLQKKDLINYSEYILNTTEYEIFEDAGYSAKNTDRPGFQKMMTKIRNKEFTHVLVWKIDRISRNLLDFCDMYNELKRCKVTFVSKNEQFDTSSAMGEAMLKIILVFAELERKLTGERVKAVMLERANKGLFNGGTIALGYKLENQLPVIDSNESKTIELIFNQYLKTESTSDLVRLLNANNIKTKRGGSWTTKTVADIIRNPFYKGCYRYNYRESARGDIKDKKEWIYKEDNHPAIISKDLWQKCNDIMDKNALRSNSMHRSDVTPHVFSGLLECAECGSPLYGKLDKANKSGFKPSLYVCRGRYAHEGCNQKTISDKILGNFILNFLRSFYKATTMLNKSFKEFNDILLSSSSKLIEIENIEEIYNKLNNVETNKYNPNIYSSDKDNSYELDLLYKEKNKYIRALERLEDLYLFDDEGMSEKDYILKKNKIKSKIDDVDVKLKAYSEKGEKINNEFIMQVQLFKFTNLLKSDDDYTTILNEIGREILKDFFKCIFEKILIKDKNVEKIIFKNGIEFKFIYKAV